MAGLAPELGSVIRPTGRAEKSLEPRPIADCCCAALAQLDRDMAEEQLVDRLVGPAAYAGGALRSSTARLWAKPILGTPVDHVNT